MKILKTTIIIFGFVLPLSSIAAGLQISPARLDIIMGDTEETTENIVIANPTADVQIFKVTADDYADYIIPFPKSFILESGARKTVVIKVVREGLLNQANQKLSTNLSIIANPPNDKEFSIGTGAKIPLEITVTQGQDKSDYKTMAVVSATALALVLLLAFLKRKRKIYGTGA